MRSLAYLAAALPLLSNVIAWEADEIVHVTSTRTITVCPITEIWTCTPDVPTGPATRSTTKGPGPETTTTASHGGDGGWGSSSTSAHYGNGTTSVTSATGTTGSSTTGSSTTGTTTATSCGTATVSSLPESRCNNANDRSKWCAGKSIDTDSHKEFYTGETKKYVLTLTEQVTIHDGISSTQFAINGKSPGEPIVANWGDMVEVTVVNGLTSNATTIHWHGIRQVGTNDQDGVPGISECGIAPGSSRTYKWHASSHGTGWYHSHALAQYGGGIRGPLIIHGPSTANYDYDLGTVMVDETFSQSIFQMAYNIARTRGALPPSTNYLLNGKNTSPDGSKGEAAQWVVKKDKKHLFRFINSAAQSAFAIQFDHHNFTVVSADFTPIVPYVTNTLWIQPGQRANIILHANQPAGAYYLRAIHQTGCGAVSLNNGLGFSNGIFTYEGACDTTPTPTNSTLVTAGICNDEPLASLIPHIKKSAGSAAKFSSTVKLLPGGNAAAQVFDGFGSVIRWYLGGPSTDLATNSGAPAGSKTVNVTYKEPTLKTLATLPSLAYNSSLYGNTAVLDGPANDWVYFVIQNNFQTSHPMHLHGHDFSVLGQGRGVFTADMVGQLRFDNPIRRDTALLFGGGSPQAFISGWTVIGFETDNPGAWLMHCHLIWHADGGMGLQFLEQPASIDASKYYNSPSFQNECKAYEAYEAIGGGHKHPYEAGVKRHLDGHIFHAHKHADVVRH
ncbi:hypothetical protein B0A52_05662 [Exophiala mesophila]|uniref:laccase n=1 Tax=Exophiala mesophila TaxID=212818 RepID=A0A438N298_EXOME|nr:hypothetical protein B0A52_05662 [Exophiala mesophila]